MASAVAEPDTEAPEEAADETPTFEFRAGKQTVEIPNLPVGDSDLKTLLGQIASSARKDAERRARASANTEGQRAQELQAERDELAKRLQALEDSQLSEQERASKAIERERNKMAEQLQAQTARADQAMSLFKQRQKRTDILDALAPFELVNRDDTARALEAQFRADVPDSEDGNYRTIFRSTDPDETDELTARDAAAKMLALPEYAHHLKASMRPGAGSGTHNGQRTAAGGLAFKRSELQRSAEARKEHKDRLLRGELVDIIDDISA